MELLSIILRDHYRIFHSCRALRVNTMASRCSSGAFSQLAVIVVLLVPDAQALKIVNKQSCKLTVFAPPICQPCQCPNQQPRNCLCTRQCNFVPGVDVKVGERATLPVKKEYFPVAFLTVEVEGVAFVVKAADLTSITSFATLVVISEACGKGKQGSVALLYTNPKFAQCKHLCLVRGERYDS